MDDRLVFTFTAAQGALAAQLTQNRAWLEELASKAAGRKVTVAAEQDASAAEPAAAAETAPPADSQHALKLEAMNDQVVQAMLDVFPAEIRTVEKIDR